jgi:hypothetical protein
MYAADTDTYVPDEDERREISIYVWSKRERVLPAGYETADRTAPCISSSPSYPRRSRLRFQAAIKFFAKDVFKGQQNKILATWLLNANLVISGE